MLLLVPVPASAQSLQSFAPLLSVRYWYLVAPLTAAQLTVTLPLPSVRTWETRFRVFTVVGVDPTL